MGSDPQSYLQDMHDRVRDQIATAFDEGYQAGRTAENARLCEQSVDRHVADTLADLVEIAIGVAASAIGLQEAIKARDSELATIYTAALCVADAELEKREGIMKESTYFIAQTFDGFLVFPDKAAADRHFDESLSYDEYPEYEYLAEFFEEKYAHLFVRALELADAGAPITEGIDGWDSPEGGD